MQMKKKAQTCKPLKLPIVMPSKKKSVKKKKFKEVAQVCPKTNCQEKFKSNFTPIFIIGP
jgi:hypothetical protein